MSIVEDILLANCDFFIFKVAAMSNEELLSSFKRDFIGLNDYKPETEMAKVQILEYSKIYIDEFKQRIERDSAGQLVEFAVLMKDLMKDDKTTGDTYYTRTLVRLYSYAVKKMKEKNIPGAVLKRDFL